MPTLHPNMDEVRAGFTLATGDRHTLVLPPRHVRVRLVGILFETDKTFVLPSAMPGIRRLKQIYDDYAGCTVLVSGHADRAGAASHNLALSVERAQAVAAFLQDQVEDWLGRYRAASQKSLVWGTREDQYMLTALLDGTGAPYLTGPVTGRSNPSTRAATQRFQADNQLPEGAMNEDTRRLLIQKYMATDGTTLPAGTTVVTHGCGESHPSVATADSVALAENRRVELFFFRDGVEPPAVDPCPAGGCAEFPQWVERSARTIDVNNDPEADIFIIDEVGLPLRNATVRLHLPDGTTEDVMTDDNGHIHPRVAPGASFTIEVLDAHEGGADDSLSTASGQHFEAGGDGPAADSGGTP